VGGVTQIGDKTDDSPPNERGVKVDESQGSHPLINADIR